MPLYENSRRSRIDPVVTILSDLVAHVDQDETTCELVYAQGRRYPGLRSRQILQTLGTIPSDETARNQKRGTTFPSDIATGPQRLPFNNGPPLVPEIILTNRSQSTSTRPSLLHFLNSLKPKSV